MKTPILFLAACILALTTGSGCATTSDSLTRVMVQVKGTNMYEVEGKIVELDKLPRAVKGAGAGKDTEIMLQMPPDTPRQYLLQAYTTLQKAGYKKVLFSTPRNVTTQVGAQTNPLSGKLTPPSPTAEKPRKTAPRKK